MATRDYKKEYKQDLKTGKSGPDSDQHERQRARRSYDAKGVDRAGKDIDHIKPLRKGGKSSGYFRMTEASAGLLAGAQSQAVFLLFMTDDALKRFEASSGWTAGVDGSVAMMNVGANAQITTQTARQEIIGFVLTNAGLMGNLSLNGNRITRLAI